MYRIRTDILLEADEPKDALLLFAGFLLASLDSADEDEDEVEMEASPVVDGYVEVGLLKKDS